MSRLALVLDHEIVVSEDYIKSINDKLEESFRFILWTTKQLHNGYDKDKLIDILGECLIDYASFSSDKENEQLIKDLEKIGFTI